MTQQELKHIAPLLASIQKNGTGFTCPKDYLDAVKTQVFNELFLGNLSKDTGHTIPKKYFETVENSILLKLQTKKGNKLENNVPDGYFDTIENAVFTQLEKEKKSKIVSLKRYWIPATIAASLLLLIGIYNPLMNKQTLEVAEIEAWIEEGNLDLDTYEIAEILNIDLENINIENNIDKENLENYIDDEFLEDSFYN